MKRLVCDRCGMELTDKYDLEMALKGNEAWKAAAAASGMEPRGIIPCQNFVQCRGEMQPLDR